MKHGTQNVVMQAGRRMELGGCGSIRKHFSSGTLSTMCYGRYGFLSRYSFLITKNASCYRLGTLFQSNTNEIITICFSVPQLMLIDIATLIFYNNSECYWYQ